MTITEISEKVARDYTKELNEDDGYGFDVATIMLIATIVSEVIKMWRECKKNKEEAAKMATSPSRFERLALRQICVRTIGRREFYRSGDKLMESLLKNGQTLTPELVQQMYDEEEKDD